jgi:hypothetical protein
MTGTTLFDKDYQLHRRQYSTDGPMLLEEKICQYQGENTSMASEAVFLQNCQVWLNSTEEFWVKHYNTYESGLNQTRGGQHGLNEAYFMASLKKREILWTTRYLPVLRITEFGLNQRLWETPQDYVHSSGLHVGKLLNSLRSGDRNIPPGHQDELEWLGYNQGKSTHLSRLEIDYFPAFQDSHFGQLKRLWETPQNHVHNNVRVGRVLNTMRSLLFAGSLLDALNQLGYNNGKSFAESRFEVDIMRAFRSSLFGQKGRLWEIPQNYIQDGIRVGKVLNHLRSQSVPIPDTCKIELETLGYNSGKGFYESRFAMDYMPAFRTSIYGKERRLGQTPVAHVHNNINIGRLLSRLKMIPDEHQVELAFLGLAF